MFLFSITACFLLFCDGVQQCTLRPPQKKTQLWLAYCKHHSVETALLYIQDHLINAIESQKVLCLWNPLPLSLRQPHSSTSSFISDSIPSDLHPSFLSFLVHHSAHP